MATSNVGSIDVSGALDCLKPWEGLWECETDTHLSATIASLGWLGTGTYLLSICPHSLACFFACGQVIDSSAQPSVSAHWSVTGWPIMSHGQALATMHTFLYPHASWDVS